MKYYFVEFDGCHIEEEDHPRDWFPQWQGNVFTNREEAVKEARRQLNERIAELKQVLKEMK